MNISDILRGKNLKLVTNRPEDTIEAAAMLLTSNNIGALPVRDGDGALVGVISERDIVRGFSECGGKVLNLRVADLMTRDVVTCKLTDDVKDARRIMKRRHIRHLPVFDAEGALCGMISSRDVMESRLQETKLERDVLRDYAITR